MQWLARLALVVAIPVLGALPAVCVPFAAAAADAAAADTDIARAVSAAERRSPANGRKADRADKAADVAAAPAGKSDKAARRDGGRKAGKSAEAADAPDSKSGKAARRGGDGRKAGKSADRSRDRAARPGTSRKATSRPAKGRVKAEVDAEPTVPVHVDDPIPKPRDPDPVVDPGEPTDPGTKPTPPVRVDDPIPAPTTPSPGGGSDGGVVVEAPTTGGGSSPDALPQAQIDDLLRRKRLTIPNNDADERAVVGAEKAARPTVGKKAAARAAEAEAARAAALAAEAARAPRIALSSGGGGSTYRQHEISVLGLTAKSRQVVGALGFRILSERRSPLLGNRVTAKLRTPKDQTAEVALARARAALPELTFDLAHLYRPSGDAARVRYAADMVGAPVAGACSVDARIGLIDSGVGDHPSLAGSAITRRNFVGKDAATNVAHGTAIASIMVGDLPGSSPLAPGARLFSANVFAQDSDGLRADAHAIIAALDWLASQRVPVVNLSLMGPPDALLEQAVQAAAERGLILVAAAGNDGPVAGPAFPAAYPAVIAVAAVDARGRPYGGNNRGSYLYVSAPGVDVWGADARGGQAFWTGTSFAAPFVTATLARDVALGRARNINDSRVRIASSARDLGAPGRDPIYGYGLLQVGDGCGGGAGAGAAVLSSKD